MSTQDHTSLWVAASRDYDAEAAERRYAIAKVAALQETWTFLAAARSEDQFDARFDLVEDRVMQVCASVAPGDTDLVQAVSSGLHEDFLLMKQAGNDAYNAGAKQGHEDAKNGVTVVPAPPPSHDEESWRSGHNTGYSSYNPHLKDSRRKQAEDFKPTHTYNPNGWDQFFPTVTDGDTIEHGAPVKHDGEVGDPQKKFVYVVDSKGNRQSVDKKSLDRLHKNSAMPGAAENYVKDVTKYTEDNHTQNNEKAITQDADFSDDDGLDDSSNATTGKAPYKPEQGTVGSRRRPTDWDVVSRLDF